MDIVVTSLIHAKYASEICEAIKESAKVRGTGIAERSIEYVENKIALGDAVIALEGDEFAGFCYIETWDNKEFVVNSGLIVHSDFRKQGLAKKIKQKILEHTKAKYPEAKIFGITTGLAVLKINSELGFRPVTFSELTSDEAFWGGCKTCKNYDVLMRTNKKMCLCTGMLYDPKAVAVKKEHKYDSKTLRRLKMIKQSLFLKKSKSQKK